MSKKNARLDIRISQEKKELIERAVALKGLSITDFVINCVEEEARNTVRDYESMELSQKDSQAFARALLEHPKPSPRLTEAAERYKEDL